VTRKGKVTEVLTLPVMVALEADESNVENTEHSFVGLRRQGTGSWKRVIDSLPLNEDAKIRQGRGADKW